MPERLDLGRLGEEAMAAEVEAVAVALDRLREAADLLVGLEDDRAAPGLAEQRSAAVSPAGPAPRTSVVSAIGSGYRRRTYTTA